MSKKNISQFPTKGSFGYDLSNSIHLPSNKQKVDSIKNPNRVLTPKTKIITNLQNYDISQSENSIHELTTINDIDQYNNNNNNNNNMSITDIDADDEKESSSVYSNIDNPDKTIPLANYNVDSGSSSTHFENIISSLLKQLDSSRNEALENKQTVEKLTTELNNINSNLIEKNTNNPASSGDNMQNIIKFYTQKINEINTLNKEKTIYFDEVEKTFNNIQQIQSQYYQNNLINLQSLLVSKNKELDELKNDYQQLETWTLTLFKEFGKNSNFAITIENISRALKPPLKRSNLENIYRYLLQYLYSQNENEDLV
jgi:hypothetical protein